MKKLFFITLLMWGVMYSHETNRDPYSGGIGVLGLDIAYHTAFGVIPLFMGGGYNFHGLTGIVFSFSFLHVELKNEWYWGSLVFEHSLAHTLFGENSFHIRPKFTYDVGMGMRFQPFSSYEKERKSTYSLRGGVTVWDIYGYPMVEGEKMLFGVVKWYVEFSMGEEPPIKNPWW